MDDSVRKILSQLQVILNQEDGSYAPQGTQTGNRQVRHGGNEGKRPAQNAQGKRYSMKEIKNMILGVFLTLLGFLCLFFAITPIVFAGYILIITGILTVLINYAKDSKPQ